MKPTQLVSLLKACIPAKLNVLITGAPGVGKTNLVRDACAAVGADLILSHPAVSDPTDAKGLPALVEGRANFLPFGDLQRAIDATSLTVWFLDDFGQASAATQAAYMQLIHGGELNGHKISEHVVFILATNRRTDRANVSGILETVKSRCATIVQLDADLDDWTTWALGAGVSSELVAFLRWKPDMLCNFQASADMTNSPVPRTWAALDKLHKLELSGDIRHVAYQGAVGEGAATEFIGFLRLIEHLPNIDEILIDPDKSKIPSEPAVLYAIVTGLGGKATAQNFSRVSRYAMRLYEEGKGEFAAMLILDSLKHDEAIATSRDFAKVISGKLGQLISGVSK